MRRLLIIPALVLGAMATLSVQGQEKKKEQGPVQVVDLKRKDPVVYEKEVEPIFYKKCIVCHSGSQKEGNLDLASHCQQLVFAVQQGELAAVAGRELPHGQGGQVHHNGHHSSFTVISGSARS